MSAPQPTQPAGGPGDPSIRRTWWLLAGSFFLLAVSNGIRLFVDRQPLDWLTVALVIVAAIAAIAHRNAVGGLESRGRGEAESFARILRGLSRSVSGEAMVAAIVEDLIEATEADHVVVVRRRRDGVALEATLVTRRAGVPTTSTILPASLLDRLEADGPRHLVGIPIDMPDAAPAFTEGGLAQPAPVGVDWAAGSGPEVLDIAASVADPHALDAAAVAAAVAVTTAPPEVAVDGPPDGLIPTLPTIARRASDTGGGRTLVRRVAAEGLALLRDVGLPTPDVFGARGTAKPSEVLARGEHAVIAGRVADRVRAAFGLAHTLTAPLRSEPEVIGAIVLSRRERHAWPQSARRLLRVAASETAAALERADSFRAVETSASTDPLTGLPNRRYFDEFSSLLAGRRRSGDAVAILMIDIDKFKGLNDTYGHPVGDEVLRAVATAITTAVRDQDVPARIGGEEFAVLLRNPGPSVALEVGERVRQAVRELDLADLGVPGVSVSVGVADATSPDEPIHALVDRADRALLRAKRAGRDRVLPG
ncbi:MAG TPA: sensor domain-containing diguanylate cyclase [Candidatus Limnocylindria bacterium]|nr:sensor domain-containing diguanylate cyclase [Candidatus Limnocylindria bacterium]